MEDSKKHLYLKFKMSKELGIMENMIVSESRPTVDEWKGTRSEGKEPDREEKEEKPDLFQKVGRDFESSINTFQRTVPFMMHTMPFMRRIHDDFNIRKFAAKEGELLDKGEFELYQVSFDHMASIMRKMEESSAIGSGINNVPGLFLTGLVSAYDMFLSQLIRCIFVTRPELLSSSERNISFKDLTEIGSVEAARERIIEKEVESVIRDSHAQQIDWLERKLNDMPLRKDLAIWPEFIEICERRNLLSHTNGVISSQYLAVCKEHKVDITGLSVGDRVKVTGKYYERAVSVILEFGTKLAQVIWRKLLPAQIGLADQELNELSYRLITKRRYGEASKLLRFGLYEMKKHGEDATKKSMVVNLANAVKLGGNKTQAEQILTDEDWSAATDKYKVCVAAVRDDVQTVVLLMKPVVAAGYLRVSDFQDWPVFEVVRSDPVFIETFEREFGQKIVADQETPPPLKVEAGAQEDGDAVSQPTPEGNTVH